MFKYTADYVDYNGNPRHEDFRFNLTEAEVVDMEISVNGGLSTVVERLTQLQDQAAIASIFKTIIEKAYGVKSDDGKRFIKSKDLFTEFSQTQAYSDLYMKLARDAEFASEFVNGIIPKIDPSKYTIKPLDATPLN